MKRRNGPDGKMTRRPLKRPKISENFYGSSLVYIKLLFLWGLVLIADYFLEFRFEYLWPFWLFLRSVYDSFKYQGLAFSVFFVVIALTSDMICFLFIPVHWLFFAASTYVWVQYVWHTEKGICLPTVFLWLLFVYIEASIRLKEFKAHIDFKHLPFHLDLCRPFAAHCIGYPVVTLGFGFKSYVGYRMRQRRQKDVQKDNNYYYEFCREALPRGSIRDDAFNPHPPQSPKSCLEDRVLDQSTVIPSCSLSWNGGDSKKLSAVENGTCLENRHSRTNSSEAPPNGGSIQCEESFLPSSEGDGGGKKSSSKMSVAINTKESSKRNRDNSAKSSSSQDQVSRLEGDVKRLKCDLQLSRNKENELRDQIISYMSSERHLKSEISNLQVEKSVLESRISSFISTRAGEKATLSNLEKRLADERKQKADFQIKLETERKTKKDADKAEKAAHHNYARTEVAKLEVELRKMEKDVFASQERCSKAEQEIFVLRKYKESHGDPEMLVNALKALQEKNNNLEKSLSAETKLKMDLFSALGEAKRELSLRQSILQQKDSEIRELKAKIAEVLAVMPTSTPSIMSNSCGLNGYTKSNTLAMELPRSTDLSSFSRGSSKIMTLGLSNLEDQLKSLESSGNGNGGGIGLYTPSSLASTPYSPATNGNATDT